MKGVKGFKKGQSGNIRGKPKGLKNKKTRVQLERIEYVLNLLDTTIDKDIKQLTAKERAKLWFDLQEYFRPKLARVESEVHQTTVEEIPRITSINIVHTTKEQCEKAIREQEQKNKV